MKEEKREGGKGGRKGKERREGGKRGGGKGERKGRPGRNVWEGGKGGRKGRKEREEGKGGRKGRKEREGGKGGRKGREEPCADLEQLLVSDEQIRHASLSLIDFFLFPWDSEPGTQKKPHPVGDPQLGPQSHVTGSLRDQTERCHPVHTGAGLTRVQHDQDGKKLEPQGGCRISRMYEQVKPRGARDR
eukprot:768152-Hanusia_phi.AAC.2